MLVSTMMACSCTTGLGVMKGNNNRACGTAATVNGSGGAASSDVLQTSSCVLETKAAKPHRNHCAMVPGVVPSGGLCHIQRAMKSHPLYLEAFFSAHNALMTDDTGPLPFHTRHYIAIMAAARHQCLYLMRLHAQEFVANGGDVTWIRGLDHVPQKLRNLDQVNRMLAHRPWLLEKEHIENLLRGAHNWSLSELMQALIIMIHFHTLSSFVYGCGISAGSNQVASPLCSSGKEEETDDYSSDSSGESSANVMEEPSLEELMQRMEQLKVDSCLDDDGPTEEQLLERFQSVENKSLEISVPMKVKSSRRREAERFTHDLDFAYSDFAKRPHEEIQTLRVEDYSWKDHAYPLVNRLYNDIGHILDQKFDIAFTLTYNTMGDKQQVDTTAFRQAIWYYIHCMYGIRHDDYDYAQVNTMLEKGLKTYIKTVTCYPDRSSRRDLDPLMNAFRHSEKVHVNFMIMEARMQAEMLYALRAVNSYMT